MERTSISETNNQKKRILQNKKVTKINDIDVKKILVSKEEPYGTKNSFKYFIGYNDNDVIRTLCIKLHKWLVMLEYLKVTKQCLLRLVTNNC